MRSQRGVTITILVTTVVIMAVIVTAVVYNSLNSVKINKYYDMYSDIELLDEKIALYYLQKDELPIEDETLEIGNLIADYQIENVNYNPNNNGILKKIDLKKLDNITLSDTDATYYIDEKSHTIYSSHGIEVENKEVYYTVPLDYQEVNI